MSEMGKRMEYTVSSGDKRTATILEVIFDERLKKDVYKGVSPFGNQVALTLDEIDRIG